jgi:hypothetical protein
MPIDFSGMPQGMQFGAASMGGAPSGQGNVRQLQSQLAQAQAYGASPAIIAQLQLQLQNAMQDAQRSQQMDYINRIRGSGGPSVSTNGGGSGANYAAQSDPFLMQLLGLQTGARGGGIVG